MAVALACQTLGLAALAVQGHGAWAQEASTPATAADKTLRTVQVSDSAITAEKDATTDGTGDYVVTAVTIGKTPLALDEIPQSVSVLTRQQMDDQNLVTVDQALRQLTGVTTNLYGDTTAGFMARGYTLQTQYDGVPASDGLQTTPQFDLAMYDRIELLRGPNGLLQGAGAPSGSVNFVRKRPQREFALSYSATVGSYANKHADVDIGGPVNEAGTLRARAVLASQDKGHPNGVQRNRQTMAYVAVDADVSENTTLSLSGSWQQKSVQRFMGIPKRTSTGQLVESDVSSFFGASGGYSNYPMHEILAEATHRFADSTWVGHVALREKTVTTDLLYGYLSTGVSASNTATVTKQRSYYQERNRGLDVYASSPFEWLGRQHQITVGYNADQYLYEGGGASTTLSNQSIFTTDFDLDSTPAITTIRARRKHQSGVYGTTRWTIADPLVLTVGLRVSDYFYETRTLATTPTAWRRWERAEGQVTPFAGLVWKLSPEHSAYVSYSDIFSPQDYFDKNGRLPSVVGWQVETGVKSKFFQGRLNTSASVYRIQEKNKAFLDTSNTGCDGTGNTCYTAAGLVQSQGIELEAIGRMASDWDVSAGYTYNENVYLQAATASNIGAPFSTTTPRHMLKLWSNYRLPGNWNRYSVGTGMQSQSQTYNSTLYQGGYTVFSAQAGYQVDKKSNVTLTIDNLTDKVYLERLGSSWGYSYYGAPRTLTLTYKSSF